MSKVGEKRKRAATGASRPESKGDAYMFTAVLQVPNGVKEPFVAQNVVYAASADDAEMKGKKRLWDVIRNFPQLFDMAAGAEGGEEEEGGEPGAEEEDFDESPEARNTRIVEQHISSFTVQPVEEFLEQAYDTWVITSAD